jgi:hypothetical protein
MPNLSEQQVWILDQTLDALQKARCRRAIDQAMVKGQAQGHHLPHDDGTV